MESVWPVGACRSGEAHEDHERARPDQLSYCNYRRHHLLFKSISAGCISIRVCGRKIAFEPSSMQRSRVDAACRRAEGINEARGRIGEDAWPTLWEDQKTWVKSYATACGVPPDRAPPIPVPASVKACFK